MSKADVMKKANWSSLAFMYKISSTKLMHKIHNNLTPDAVSAIIKNNHNIKRYQLKKNLKIDVPRLNRNSVARRGAIVWNTLIPQLNDDIDNVKKYDYGKTVKGSATPGFRLYLHSNINQKGGRF